MTLALVLGAGVGLGLVGLRYALLPPRPDLAARVARWDAGRRRATGRAADQAGVAWRTRLGRRVGETLAARGVEMRTIRADLEITARALDRHLADKVLHAVAGFVLAGLCATGMAAAGVVLPVPVTLLVGAGFAGALVVLSDVALHREAERRRAELRHVLGSYLDLVSMSLAGGRGVPEALPTAAAIGQGWAFELLASTISRARYTGITPWEALGQLGERTDLAELRDLASSLKLVSDDGAQVARSLSARATTLRRRQLADAEGDAQQASQSMRIAQIVIAVGFFVFIGFPAVINIFNV